METVSFNKPGKYSLTTEQLFNGVNIVLGEGLHMLEDINEPGEYIVSSSIEELQKIAESWASEGSAPLIH